MIRPRWTVAYLLFSSIPLLGCNNSPANRAESALVEVQVAEPVLEKDFEDYEIFTGRTEAKRFATIRARVSGYLNEARFEEGKDVKKDNVLFIVDPAPYQAVYDQTNAAVAQAEAHRARLELDYKRALELFPQKGISQQEYDQTVGDYKEAVAAVGSATANRKAAKLNVDYTQVHAPFDGRISRRLVDPGNLIKQDDTAMAMLLSLDPIYGYFDVDERTVLKIRNSRAGTGYAASEIGASVKIGLANEPGFSHSGTIVIPDNRIDATTGTRRMWAEFENPAPHDMMPGMFIRARVGLGLKSDVLCVAESALGSDQARRFLFVLNNENMVVRKFVEVGSAVPGDQGEKTGLVVIKSNLDPNDRVVLNNLQRIREKDKVAPTPVKMPRQDPNAGLKLAGMH
jgi:multidrug efflux system membrane fusion protein